MARISTYTVDGAPVSSDKLIGTDSSGVATKNYPLGSVADWLKESGASAVLGQTNYKFQVVLDPDAGREPGSISFSDYGGDGTEFISVSALMVSNLSSTGQYIGDYLLSTVGDRVMLGQLDDLNNFGVYRLVSLIQNPVEPTFFDAELLFVEGNGALMGNKTYGLATYSASASAGSAIWGSIEGAIANQTDLVEYIDTEISEIPAPTLETVTNGGNTTTNNITVNSVVANGTLQLSAYTAGLLQTDAAGNVSLDTTSYSTFSGNYDDLENKPYIPITGVDFDPVGTDNSTNVTLLSVTENYLSIFGQEITAGIVPISLGGTGAETAADARSSLNVDVAGTDNSTNVTLSGEYDYLTLAGQEITLEQIDYDTDILNTPILGTAAASAATDFVAVTGDTMTGDLIINKNNPRIAFSDQGAIMNMRYDGGIFYIDPASGSNRYVRITNSGAGSIDLSVDGNVGIGTTSPNAKLDVNNSAVGEYAYFGSGSTRQLRLSSYNTVSDHAGHKINASSGNGEITLATNSIAALTVKNDQTIQLNAYGVGYLKSDASGNITVDSDTIEDTLDSVTTRGNTTSNNITVGSITANGNITTNTGVFYSGNGTKLDLNQYNAGYLRLLTDNTERLRVTATGNVGIGTTSPSAPLHIEGGTTSEVIKIEADADPYIRFVENGTNVGFLQFKGAEAYLSNQSNGTFFFRTNNTDKMVITAGGNVGIGTTSPSYKLDIAGDVQVQSAYFLRFANEWGIQQTGTNLNFAEIGSADGRLYLKAGGNVGIGTTSPSKRLHIYSGAANEGIFMEGTGNGHWFNFTSGTSNLWSMGAQTGLMGWYNRTNSTYKMVITDAGNIGIGTTSPSRKLHIVDSVWNNSSGGGVIFENSNTVGASLTLKPSASVVTNGANGWALYAGGPGAAIGDGNLGFWAHATNDARMVIQRGGNVGIGTTSPASKLDVNGNIAIKGNPIINRTGNVLTIGDIDNIDSVANISIDSANGSTIVLLDDNGHVGFNETSPNSTVDINGTAMEQLRLRTPGGPSSNSDISGREGDFAYDDLYLYIKTGSGWGRVALDFAF